MNSSPKRYGIFYLAISLVSFHFLHGNAVFLESLAGSVIKATRMVECEDCQNRGNQSGVRNSLTISEVNAIIGFRDGLDQVSKGRQKSSLLANVYQWH